MMRKLAVPKARKVKRRIIYNITLAPVPADIYYEVDIGPAGSRAMG